MTSNNRNIIDLRRGNAPAPRLGPEVRHGATSTERRVERVSAQPPGESTVSDSTSAQRVMRRRRVSEAPVASKAAVVAITPTTDTPAAGGDEAGTLFSELGLIPELQQAVATAGYTHPTPIQAQAIPPLLQGSDLLGIAQTGTGKTAAFTLPVLQRLNASQSRRRHKRTRVLVLTPTRELAIQIGDSFATYGRQLRLQHTVIFGGVPQGKQVRTMASGVDILVATPGRLLDLIGQGFIQLDSVEAFILDEADRMLDMGFIHDVKKIIAHLPTDRQTLLFSATMPSAITQLASNIMRDYERVEVTPSATTVEIISQSLMFVDKGDKKRLLADIFASPNVTRAIVFSRTKRGANRIAEFLDEIGVTAAPLHGNKSQGARQRALAAFQEGRVRALVATDIAARGIDVDLVSHVINFDLPNEPDSYVHRIGRTARAGNGGVALSFCMRDELDYLRAIEKVIRQQIPVRTDHAFHSQSVADDFRAGKRGSVKQGGGGGGGRGRMNQRGPRRGGSPPRHGGQRRGGSPRR